eukprot:15367003-Ditylum_brightwellii.AAC.2
MFENEVGNISVEFDTLGKQIRGEWDKQASNVPCLFRKNSSPGSFEGDFDLSACGGRNGAKSIGKENAST